MQVRAFEQQRESMQRLQELDRAKDAFISTVSHELRTPLTSIVGYLEMITEGGPGPVPEASPRASTIIERNAVRLRDLVEDLLTLSAYDAAQVQLDRRPTNLGDSSGVPAVADARHRREPVEVDRGPAPAGCRWCSPTQSRSSGWCSNLLSNASSSAATTGR